MTTGHQTSQPVTPTAPHRRLRAAAVGAAVLATSQVWLAAHALGTNFRLADSQGVAVVDLPLTIGFTIIFSLLGWGTLALLEHYTRRARTIWSLLATAVLLLSIVPIFLEEATSGTKIALSLIHLAVAAVLIPMLRRATPKSSRV
jgi:hypothetical protein